MKVSPTTLPEVLLIEPKVFGDERGFFLESFQQQRYSDAGIEKAFVQDNLSSSEKGVLRGLHLQHPNGQGKLVQVISGSVIDVAVDVRVGSPNFGKHVAVELNQSNHHQLYIPPGFAHGFLVTSPTAIFHYKCTALYDPESEISIIWNDRDIGISWGIDQPAISSKDGEGLSLADAKASGKLPNYP